MFESFIQPVADIAANVLGGVASLINPVEGEIHPAPTDGRVTLPQDLFAQPGADRVVVLHRALSLGQGPRIRL